MLVTSVYLITSACLPSCRNRTRTWPKSGTWLVARWDSLAYKAKALLGFFASPTRYGLNPADDALHKNFVKSIQRQASRTISKSNVTADYRVVCPEHHAEWCYYKPKGDEHDDQEEVVESLLMDLVKMKMLMRVGGGAAYLVGSQIGLSRDCVHANLLPKDKLHYVEKLQENAAALFCGDGVNDTNDALALALAKMGMSMCKGAILLVALKGMKLLPGHTD
ncbi:hypothetical protein ACA910_005402 [Epithemia clementina (nom. ined.)]